MVSIDVPHVFRVFNGPQGLLDLLTRRQPGHGLSYNRVQMWQQRGSIPTKFIGAVFYCIEHEGYKVVEFLVDYDEMRPPSHNKSPASRGMR
jgi:hypothetical protein